MNQRFSSRYFGLQFRAFVFVSVRTIVQLRISVIYSYIRTVRLRENHVIAGCVVSVPFNCFDTNCAQAYASTNSAVRLMSAVVMSASTERGAARLISGVVLTVPVRRVVL
jgi:hypothetical protein